MISHVDPESPAADAGLRVGDIILRFDGRAIEQSSELPHIVGLTKPGTRVSVVVMRAGKERRLRVTVGELDSSDGEKQAAAKEKAGASNPLGLDVEPLSDELKTRWNVSHGVLVARVAEGSPAALAKLQKGDVLTLIDSEAVASVRAFQRIVRALPSGKMVALRVVRRGRAGFVAIEVP